MSSKVRVAVLVIIFVVLYSVVSFAADIGSMIEMLIQRRFDPDVIEVSAKGVKECDKNVLIDRLWISTEGAKIGMLRIDKLVLEADRLLTNSSDEWNKKDKFKVLEVSELRFYARIKKKDIDKFISFVEKKKNNSHFSRAKLKFKPPFLVLAVVYNYDLIFKVRIMLELKSRLSVKGNKVFFTDYELFAAGLKLDDATTGKIINKINPLIDLKKFPFPVRLAKILVNHDSLELYTSPPPKF